MEPPGLPRYGGLPPGRPRRDRGAHLVEPRAFDGMLFACATRQHVRRGERIRERAAAPSRAARPSGSLDLVGFGVDLQKIARFAEGRRLSVLERVVEPL